MIEVILPCRNAPEALWLTLTSLWAHAYDPKYVSAVTLIDNCSTDPQMGNLFRMAVERYPETHRVIRNDRNVGVWCSVNRGLALARSEYVFVLTADVLLARGTFEVLYDFMRGRPELSLIGPEVHTGIGTVPHLATVDIRIKPDLGTYNGAAWMMHWPYLRERVGWYDPRFYVCYGDTDYIERMRLAKLSAGVARGLPCVHLDKQSRRADGTVRQDSETEVKDALEFHNKWASHPEIIARHRLPSVEGLEAFKNRDLGGWQAAKVG